MGLGFFSGQPHPDNPHVATITLEAGADDPVILASTVDPSAAAGVEAQEGSIHLRHVDTAGEAWLKTGAADTAWTQFVGTGDLTSINAQLALLGISNDGVQTQLLGTAGDYWVIGTGTTGHSLDSENDLLIPGDLEVDGVLWADGIIQLAINAGVGLGGNGVSTLALRSTQTPTSLVMSLPVTSRALIFAEHGDHAMDFGHAQAVHPTTWYQNADANSIHGAGGIWHDDDDFTFSSERGGYSFELAAQFAQGTLTFGGGLPTAEDTFVINATTITAKTSGAVGDEFNIGVDEAATIVNFVAAVNAGTESANVKAWDGAGDTVVFEWLTAGTAGNAIVFTTALANTTIDGGGTLGGTHAGIAASATLGITDAGLVMPNTTLTFDGVNTILATLAGSLDFHDDGARRLSVNSAQVQSHVTLLLTDAIEISHGSTGDVRVGYQTAQTPDSFVIGLGADSNAMIICRKADRLFDFAFADLTNPAIVVCSGAQTTDERGWITHDRTDFVIDADKGNVRLGRNLARTTAATITAGTSQSQGQVPLTADINQITTVEFVNDVVTMPAAVAGMVIFIVNMGVNTLQIFPASGDDLGAGVDISVFLEVNEEITFSALDATTWHVAASTQITHAEMTDSQNTDAFVVHTTALPHCYHTNGLAAGDLSGWTFDAGGAGTVPAITVIATDAGGIKVTTGAAHGLEVGDVISITDTGDPAYDIVHVVLTVPDTTNFTVSAAFTATGTGFVDQAATLTANAGQAGTYVCHWAASATLPVGSNETFDFVIYVGAVAQAKTEVRRKFGTAGDFGSMGNTALLTIADGDVVSFTLQNDDSAADTTIRNFNLTLIRL